MDFLRQAEILSTLPVQVAVQTILVHREDNFRVGPAIFRRVTSLCRMRMTPAVFHLLAPDLITSVPEIHSWADQMTLAPAQMETLAPVLLGTLVPQDLVPEETLVPTIHL